MCPQSGQAGASPIISPRTSCTVVAEFEVALDVSKASISLTFVITLFKDVGGDQKRVNVKKIVSLDNLFNNNYKKVSIEIDEKLDLKELKKLLEKKGETEVELIIRQKDTKFTIKLENPRKFDLKLFNEVKNREYVKKITF